MSLFDGTSGPTLRVQFFILGSWVDVPITDVREVGINRGRKRFDQRNDAGVLTVVLDNRSGDYDPDKTNGPYFGALNEGLQVRFVATWNSTATVMYRGFLESVDCDYGFDPTATITCVDALARLAKSQAPGLSSRQFAGETTATRVNRLLTIARWPTGALRNVAGGVLLRATTQGAPVLDLIDECVKAEAGVFFASRTGVVTFQPLTWKFSRPTQLLLSDSQAANTVEYDELVASPGALQVVNQAVVQVGTNPRTRRQVEYRATLTASVDAYGLSRIEWPAPIQTASVARSLARYLARKDSGISTSGAVRPRMQVESVSFEAAGLASNLWDDLLETELQDQITVTRTTVDERTVTGTYVVEGLNHQITPDSWRVTFHTSALNPWRPNPALTG